MYQCPFKTVAKLRLIYKPKVEIIIIVRIFADYE